MGYSRYSTDDWTSYKKVHIDNKTDNQIFSSSTIHADLDPKKITLRESCDSVSNPKSTPIIIALDVTGSMGEIAVDMARHGIKTTFEEILNRKPVPDPHLMIMGVGDAEAGDEAPLQVSQFESDIKIVDQLSKVYIEGHGGGNGRESYNMPWYFAATKTKIDSVEKRGKKGVLFTIGDEEPAMTLYSSNVKKYIGDNIQADIPSADLLALVQQKYDVFHIIVEQGDHARYNLKQVKDKWNKLLGKEHVIPLSDYKKLSEVIVSTLQVRAGENADDVANSWDGSTNVVVARAVSNLATTPKNNNGGLVRFGT